MILVFFFLSLSLSLFASLLFCYISDFYFNYYPRVIECPFTARSWLRPAPVIIKLMVIIFWLAACSQWLSGERFPFAVRLFGLWASQLPVRLTAFVSCWTRKTVSAPLSITHTLTL
jgi:hypothetical protein